MSNNEGALVEKVVHGTPVSSGIAIGNVQVFDKVKRHVLPKSILNTQIPLHKENFKNARQLLIQELDEMLVHLDKTSAEIIESQKHIVLDPEIERMVHKTIEVDLQGVDYAVYSTYSIYIEKLKESGSELFQQRIVDLENLRDRFVDLVCEDDNSIEARKGAIVIAKELSPTELVQLHENGIAGLVLEKGGLTSHAALIARALGIPCIVNAKNATLKAKNGKAILDGVDGRLILKPSKELVTEYKLKHKNTSQRRKQLQKSITGLSRTKSGTNFTLSANLEFLPEIDQVNFFGISDIGLLRTEWLLLSGKASEKEQAAFYEQILEGIKGTVVVRLFDVGGDKLGEKKGEEANPFLGWRGIRRLLDEQDVLRSQLKALFKTAGKYPGRLKILVPMISVEEEVIEVKKVIEEVKNELTEVGIKIDSNVPLGIMIEVPSAALIANKLAKHVEFFSIGTNDLAQYTLAVDRGNSKISALFQHHHPAVWYLIKLVVKAAQVNKIEVSVCGELAGDTLGACGLFGLGIRDLSMSPSSITKVKEELIAHTDSEFENLADEILSASNSEQIISYFSNWKAH